jgi:hypothetical protein
MQRSDAAHAQTTLPQAFVSVLPHCPAQFGKSQQALSMHTDAAPQPNRRVPQELVTSPQKSALGRDGKLQHLPGPSLPELEHVSPLPQELAEQFREPQALLRVVLHGAPSPPHVGSSQQLPGAPLAGCSQRNPD